ncbi:MAG: SRPBCC domain-containing protein [Terriglobia bacterium]
MARTKKATVVGEPRAIMRPLERVGAALTTPRDPGALTFGRIEMRAEPGAAFSWHWGLWEKIAPRKGSFTWRGTVLDVVPHSTLVLGPDPVVTLTVKGQGSSTLVTVVQPVTGKVGEDYEYGWADFLLRLKTRLETENLEGEVLARTLVKGSPQQVYRAWLDPKALVKILPGKARLKAKAWQRFSWQPKRSKEACAGIFLELRKNKRISFTWEATQPASEVDLGMQPAPYGTLVSVHHKGLARLRRGQLFELQRFWSRLLERLRGYAYFKGKIKAAD